MKRKLIRSNYRTCNVERRRLLGLAGVVATASLVRPLRGERRRHPIIGKASAEISPEATTRPLCLQCRRCLDGCPILLVS